jgi:hypothetical protein
MAGGHGVGLARDTTHTMNQVPIGTMMRTPKVASGWGITGARRRLRRRSCPRDRALCKRANRSRGVGEEAENFLPAPTEASMAEGGRMRPLQLPLKDLDDL